MEELILALATKYPVLVTVLTVIGTLRLVMKPLFSFLHEYVLITETKKDDELLAKVEGSKYFKWVMYVLDYLASVKVKK